MQTTDMMEWPVPVWPTSRLEESRKTLASEPDGSFHVALAWIRILSAAGDLEGARLKLAALLAALDGRRLGSGELRQVIPVALLIHDQPSALHFLAAVFPTTIDIGFAVTKAPEHSVVSMRVAHRSVTFVMSDTLFSNRHGEILLQRLIDVYPILAYYLESSLRSDGTVAISLGDAGDKPGLAFCDNRPGYFLIPDSMFMDTRGYSGMRERFANDFLPWEKRSPTAFWRGTTTGRADDPKRGWRSLPRVRLCEIGAENLDLIDAGITKVIQIDDPVAEAWIAEAGLLRPFVAPESFQQYKYQIDIDGNTTSWPGLFMKLLTGSVVLKVPPRAGFEQWYYDRLKPWVNFVPLAPDLSDLVEKVRWLRDNDDVARMIGEAGCRLAEDLTYEQEIVRAAPTVAAALKDASGLPLIDFDFSTDGAGSTHLGEGWLLPDGTGVDTAGFQSCIELPLPPGIGGFIVRFDVSPTTGENQRLSIAVDGELLAQQRIGARTTFYVPLARRFLANKTVVTLTLLHPAAFPAASAASPGDTRILGIRLHRIAVLGIGPMNRDQSPDVTQAISDLRAIDKTDQVQDLSGPATQSPPGKKLQAKREGPRFGNLNAQSSSDTSEAAAVQTEVGGVLQEVTEDKRTVIYIIGASNSVMKDGFSQVIGKNRNFSIENLSIGGTTNVLLLNVAARNEIYGADYIIIETCVLDQHYGALGRYSRESSIEALELFITEVRTRSNAEIIILTIPTRFGLLEPQRQWAEQLYREIAERYGIPLLDGYALVRNLLGHRQAKQGQALVARSRRLLNAFGLIGPGGLPDSAPYALAWAGLRQRHHIGNALGWFSFSDELHLSRRMHRLVGDMLTDFIQASAHRGGFKPDQPDDLIVTNAEMIFSGTFIERYSNLISRRMAVVCDGDQIVYRCPLGWRAVGLLINQKPSFGELRMITISEFENLSLPGLDHPASWVSVVLPLRKHIGDSDIAMSIHAPEGMSGDLEPRAELAELTLVRTDWRTQRDTDAVKRPSGFERIDNRRSALDMTRVAVVEAEDFVANLDNGGLLTSAAIDLLPLIARIYSSKEPNAVIAATFLLIHDINKLHAFLNTCSQTEIIGQMKEGLTDAFAPPHEDPRALVARIIALRKEGRLDEAVKLSVEADVLYPSEALFRIQLAGIAQDQGDWCRALSHWAIVREEFPYINSGFIGGANCLVQAGQSGKAVAVIADGLEKLPDDPAIWNTALGIAEHMDDGDEVRQRLAEIRGRSSSEVLR